MSTQRRAIAVATAAALACGGSVAAAMVAEAGTTAAVHSSSHKSLFSTTHHSKKEAPIQKAASRTLVVGARAKDTSFVTMDQAIGPVAATRWFSPGTGVLPAKFIRQYAGSSIATGVDVWASYNSASEANLRSYVASADPGTKMVLHHEPEGDFSSGKAYTAWFTSQAKIIHAVNPSMPVVHAAAAYGYRVNGEGYDCSYVPKDADIYTIDTYRRKLPDMVPLSKDDRFQRWLSCLPADKPMGITEYGRGLVTTDKATNAKRAELIKEDAAYLRSLGRAVVWMYWWTSGGAGNWRFTDQASIDAWGAAAQQP